MREHIPTMDDDVRHIKKRLFEPRSAILTYDEIHALWKLVDDITPVEKRSSSQQGAYDALERIIWAEDGRYFEVTVKS